MFWWAAGILLLLVILPLLLPLVRSGQDEREKAGASAFSLYQRRLLHLARALESGDLTEEEAEEKRAALALAHERARGLEAPLNSPGRGGTRLLYVLLLVTGLPGASFGLYALLGHPGMSDLPLARRGAEQRALASLGEGEPDGLLPHLIRQTMGPLSGTPLTRHDDLALVAELQSRAGRFLNSADYWFRAAGRVFRDLPLRAGYWARGGEMLVAASGGQVGAEARAAFARALADDPNNARARFYHGLALEQQGRHQDALAIWLPLARSAASGADAGAESVWQKALQDYTEIAAIEMGVELAALIPEKHRRADLLSEKARAILDWETMPGGPTPVDIAAAMVLDPEEQLALVYGLVDEQQARLRRDPDNAEGWRRLGRILRILGQVAPARKALANAVRLSPRRPELLMDYARALMEPDPEVEPEQHRKKAGEPAGPLPGTGDILPLRMPVSRAQSAPDPLFILSPVPELETGPGGAGMSVRLVAVLTNDPEKVLLSVLELEPEHSEAMLALALLAEEQEDLASARLYWERLLLLLDPSSLDGESAWHHWRVLSSGD